MSGSSFEFASHADRGEESQLPLYVAVGRFISEWETLEYRLSRLHSLLLGYPRGDAIGEYGAGKIFRERFDILKREVDRHFMAHSNQELEAMFNSIARAVTYCADRRNEIAHSIVFDVSLLEHFRYLFRINRQKPVYLLIPPAYLARKNMGDVPAYAYSAFNVDVVTDETIHCRERIVSFRRAIEPPLARRK
jgi:hypothetical protein